MKIKSAEFLMSNSNVIKAPKDRIPEYAFIGRSNVGKSSLINMLMERKDLAKISGKPGKTQLINHFKINDEWFLVDLPGYGYAQISKKKRTIFQYFKRTMVEQKEEMYNYCSNYEENLPLDKEAFPMVEDTSFCRYCNFKELCQRN